jgi:chaperonin GroEL (HSP60 family)
VYGLLQLTRGIEKTVAGLVEELQQLSVEVRDEDLANVATVSAGGNEVVSTQASASPVCKDHCGY